MNIILQPDPEDGRNVNVNVTFDESDGQFPQPWRLYVIELQDLYKVESGTDDQAVTLEREGIFTFEISSNTSTTRVKYSTGEGAKVEEEVPLPVQITSADPNPLPVWTGFEGHPIVFTGTGFTTDGEFGPNVVMAALANAAGAEVTSGGGQKTDTTYTASFTSLPPGVVSGDKVFGYTKNAMMEVSSNKFEITLTDPPPPPPKPVITAVTPNTGPMAGGTAVTITGSLLAGASGVWFANIAATAVVAVDDATVTCVTPAQANPLTGSVQVQADAGYSDFFNSFTYTAAEEDPIQ